MNNSLKIVSYNIHMGLECEAIVKNLSDLTQQGTAIFCLQEFWTWKQPQDLKSLLLNMLGGDWQMEFVDTTPEKYDYGLCMLWNTKILENLSFYNTSLPQIPKAKWWEKIWLKLNSIKPEGFVVQRGFLSGIFTWNGKTIRITNIHADWQGGDKQRAKQLLFVKDYLNAQPTADYEIVCGDLNMLGWINLRGKLNSVRSWLPDGFISATDKPYRTIAGEQLDYMFTKNLSAQNFKVLKIQGSDHYPITAELTLKEI